MAKLPAIQRILIWSKWLRLAHWLMALPALGLFASGWLIDNAPLIADTTMDIHLLLAPLLAFGLGLRILLLFIDKENAGFKSLTPSPEWRKIGEMLKFYFSFGRMPLPRWYAHNPLWAPLYIFFIALLLVQTISGYLLEIMPIIAGIYLPSLHATLATLLFAIMLLHIISVVLHDLKGTASDISAMISGYRFFVPGEKDGATEVKLETSMPSIAIKDIKKE